MKISFRDKKFRIIIVAFFFIVLTTAGLYLFGVFGNSEKLVMHDGIPVSKGSAEDIFLQEYELNSDGNDWKEQSDYSKVDRAITKRLTALAKVLKSGNIKKIEKYFNETNRDEYKAYMEQNPDSMDGLSKYIKNLEMTYLAADPGSGSTYYRTAEYEAGAEGESGPVILVLIDGDWYIDSL